MFYVNVLQVGGLFVSIEEAKKEANEQVSKHALTMLTVTDNDFATGRAHYVNKKEISVDGKLYDIAATTKHTLNTTFSVYHDEKEEGFIASMKDAFENILNTPKNSKHPTGKHLLTIKDFVPANKFALFIASNFSETFSVINAFAVQPPCLLVPHSPPNLG